MPVTPEGKNAPVVLTPIAEKPFHYTYLKEFRTEQCQLFLQHKCSQHRPYTCFYWHFMNQRRRRPVRHRDGSFNYSPDIYCTKYDETTGLCPDSDDCPYLHRCAGDTERRYHLRYYKTGICIYESDARSQCVKNGPHCAFAHGPNDLRPPVHDVRELQLIQNGGENGHTEPCLQITAIDKERNSLNEDPRWQEVAFVLANYKTDTCKRPPRLCRQGYACPCFHNSRDRRRTPKNHKYRSTPCPNVKHGDEWGDPNQCEQGDGCQYCHTRTEQQFHPEIYKSTKCNDMQQNGVCPRGPFCAFAHFDQEIVASREVNLDMAPTCGSPAISLPGSNSPLPSSPSPQANQLSILSSSLNPSSPGNPPGPIAKPRSASQSSGGGGFGLEMYGRAPGSEREDSQAVLRRQLLLIENDMSLSEAERAKRKQTLWIKHGSMNPIVSSLGSSVSSTPPTPSSMGQHVPPLIGSVGSSLYAPSDTLESVVGSALDDLNLEDFDVAAIEREFENDSASIGSGPGSAALGPMGLVSSSQPVNIPGASMMPQQLQQQQQHLLNTSHATPPSPMNPHNNQFISPTQQQSLEHVSGLLGNTPMRPLSLPNLSPSTCNLATNQFPSNLPSLTCIRGNEIMPSDRLKHQDDFLKLTSFDAEWQQARRVNQTWKADLGECGDNNIVKGFSRGVNNFLLDGGCNQNRCVVRTRPVDAVTPGYNTYTPSSVSVGVGVGGNTYTPHNTATVMEDDGLPLSTLKQMQNDLRSKLDKIDKMVIMKQAVKCLVCEERNRTRVVLPCRHYSLCEHCATIQSHCPMCHGLVTQTIPS